MKKIIFILSLLTLVFSISMVVQADYNENEAELLRALNIMDVREDNADDTVTRGEFAEYAVRFMAIDNVPATKEYSFADVSQYSPQADSIYTLKAMNILAGAGDGNFYPDEMITENQAAIVTARMLGYGAVSQNVEFDAVRLNISGMSNEPITLGELVSVFFKALECECINEIYTGAQNDYEFKENYLSEIFGVYYGNGVLTQNSLTTLDGNGDVKENITVIENKKLKNTGYDVDEHIGMNVDYYYLSERRSDNNEDTLICAFPTSVNSVTEIKARDIISSDGKTIKYSAGDKTKSITIDASADVIYNGIACPDYELSMLSPRCGMITYIENGTESDCIKIDEYVNAIVSSVTDEFIYLRNGDKIEFDKFDDGKLIIYDESGNKTETVSVDSVVSIYRSFDRTYLKAVCSSKVIDNAVISEMDEESITTGGLRYLIYPGYTNWQTVLCERSGASFKLYIDAYGEVTKISKASNGLAFGYVISAYETNFKTVVLRVLVADGEIESIECAQKLSIDGERKDYTVKTLSDKLSGGNSENFAQLITYKMNSDGQINSINTAINRDTFTDSVDDKNLEGFKISYKTNSDEYYKTATKVFGTSCPVDDLTKVFFVSSNPEKQSSEYYWTGSISSLENDDRADSAIGYTTTAQLGNAEALVVFGSETVGNIGSETRIAVVKKVTQVMNEDMEIRTRVTFITGGKLVAYNLNSAIASGETSLGEGDLVRFAVDRNYEVSKLEMICDLKDDGTLALLYGESKDWCNTPNGGAAVYRIVSGSVYDYEDGLMCISRGDVNSINLETPKFEYHRGIGGAFICTVDGDEITAGTEADIVRYVDNPDDYSRVFITTRYGAVRDVVLYK